MKDGSIINGINISNGGGSGGCEGSGSASGADTGSSTRDGIALVIAAMREDPVAVAVLLGGMTPKQTQEVAVFCAFLAAGQLAAAEASQARPGFYGEVLQAVALQLAASGRTMLPDT